MPENPGEKSAVGLDQRRHQNDMKENRKGSLSKEELDESIGGRRAGGVGGRGALQR